MESVESIQALKNKALENLSATEMFTTLLCNISQNAAFNQRISVALKDINVENLNIKDYQSLYFDYIFGFIRQNIKYLNSEACIKYFVDTFKDNSWGRLISENYPNQRLEESTIKDLEKALIKINKALNDAHAKAKLSDEETPDEF